jgi:hypothetical protein
MSDYEDILLLPHHRSTKRPHMAQLDRAAQFAPFAALSGYEKEIAEAGRLTDPALELMEGKAEQIDSALQTLRRELAGGPLITVTYFVPDSRKRGGAYRTVSGRVRKLSETDRMLFLEDGTAIPFDRIFELSVE